MFWSDLNGKLVVLLVHAYAGMLIVLDAIERVTASGTPLNRDTVRDAIQTANLKTLQSIISFDENGNIIARTSAFPVSVIEGALQDHQSLCSHTTPADI